MSKSKPCQTRLHRQECERIETVCERRRPMASQPLSHMTNTTSKADIITNNCKDRKKTMHIYQIYRSSTVTILKVTIKCNNNNNSNSNNTIHVKIKPKQ